MARPVVEEIFRRYEDKQASDKVKLTVLMAFLDMNLTPEQLDDLEQYMANIASIEQSPESLISELETEQDIGDGAETR